MTRPLAERQALVAQMPWVVKLLIPHERCDGIKWGQVALKDLYTMHGKPARGIQERAKCKNKGWWQLLAAKPRDPYDHPATSGTYCWQHLMTEIDNHPAEFRRAEKWWKENVSNGS